jgi:cytoskeletal protein CcmA (bactofilin family)
MYRGEMNTRDAHTTVASSIAVSGDITAAEDVTIHGRVEGRITLPDHHLTITKTAVINARIVARSVVVSGTVDGNILAGERIHLLAGTSVRGHLTTPSIVLAEGATFSGTVDPNRSETGMQVARYRERHGG